MANFPVSRAEISAPLLKQILWKRNCALHERDSALGAIQPGILNRARIFSPGKRAWKSGKVSCIQPGPKKEHEHAHWLCFRTSVNFLSEICVLHLGWNWTCNQNNISARWAEQNFSLGWNSPCNQTLSQSANYMIPNKIAKSTKRHSD